MKNKKLKSLYTGTQTRRLRSFLHRNKNVSNEEVDQIAKDLGFKVNNFTPYKQSKIEKYSHEIATLIIGIIIFILVFGTKCSAQNNDDVKHFYTVQAISHASHDLYKFILPKKPIEAFFIGLGAGILAGEGKEWIIDKTLNKGVFSQSDRQINYWSSFCYIPIRIILNDIKKNKEINQQKQLENEQNYNFK